MGPLLPLAILFGGFYVYEQADKRELEREKVKPITRFSPQAVGLVCDVADGVRVFKLSALSDEMLKSCSVQPVSGAPQGMTLLRLVPLGIGAISAKQTIEQAHAAGLAVLGSFSLALAAPGTDDQLLLVAPPERKSIASGTSQFALILPEPKTEVVAPTPPPKVKRNGLKKLEEVEPNGQAEEIEAAEAS